MGVAVPIHRSYLSPLGTEDCTPRECPPAHATRVRPYSHKDLHTETASPAHHASGLMVVLDLWQGVLDTVILEACHVTAAAHIQSRY